MYLNMILSQQYNPQPHQRRKNLSFQATSGKSTFVMIFFPIDANHTILPFPYYSDIRNPILVVVRFSPLVTENPTANPASHTKRNIPVGYTNPRFFSDSIQTPQVVFLPQR